MKILLLTAMVFVWAGMPVLAKPRVSSGASVSRAGASALPAVECLQTALNGQIEGECAEEPETDQCVGMKLALKNSLRQDQCRARAGEGCLIYGYRQNTQAQWISVAGGYLSEALQCVRKEYGSEESNGFEQAMADPIFRAKLARLDEGASSFGLREGSLLERVLKGETLAEVVASSPAWQQIDAREKDRMKLAMENPMAPAELEPTAGTVSPGSSSLGSNSFGSNSRKPLPRMNSAPVATVSQPVASEPVALRSPSSVLGSVSVGNPVAASDKAGSAVAPLSGNIFVRAIKHNPYSLGLDLTLFDRVSTCYQKRGHELRDVEEYVKELPKHKEPRDVRDLLGRNRGTEL